MSRVLSHHHEAEVDQHIRSNIFCPIHHLHLPPNTTCRSPKTWNLFPHDLYLKVFKWSVGVLYYVKSEPLFDLSPGPASTGQCHVSIYPWSWLRGNSNSPPIKRESVEYLFIFYLVTIHKLRFLALSRKVLWGSKIAKDPPSVTFDEVMSSEYGVYKWLSKIVGLTSRWRYASF